MSPRRAAAQPFRLGLVGAGRIGKVHLRAIAPSLEVRVVAVAEPVPQTRQLLASTGMVVHGDLESMLAAGGLDGALVCVPSDQHLETVTKLSAAGLPTLCEKPCGVTQAQAAQASEMFGQGGVPLQIGYWRRYVPSLRRLRDDIAAERLGAVYLVACYQWDGEPASPSFRAHSAGIFVDMGVHEFDQTRWLTGQEFGSLSPRAAGVSLDAPLAPGDVESAHALADLSGGSSAFVSLGRRFPLGDVCRVEVYGTEGAQDCRFIWPPHAELAQLSAMRRQAESFARYARGGQREGAGGEDAVAALEVAERASAIFS